MFLYSIFEAGNGFSLTKIYWRLLVCWPNSRESFFIQISVPLIFEYLCLNSRDEVVL